MNQTADIQIMAEVIRTPNARIRITLLGWKCKEGNLGVCNAYLGFGKGPVFCESIYASIILTRICAYLNIVQIGGYITLL